jgi:GAF domain-containing protein
MTAAERVRRVGLVGDVVLAFAAAGAAFALVAVLLRALDSHVLAAALSVPCVAGVVLLARRFGAAYAVPPAMAALLAYDWYVFPPTHATLLPDGPSTVNLVVYLAVAVLVGELAAYAGRRAHASDRDRAVLADEQVALRHVATLVAQGVAPADVFAAVAEEVGTLLGADAAYLGRYESDGTVTGVGAWSRTGDALPVGTRAPVVGENVTAIVRSTGRPARVNAYDENSGPIGAMLAEQGIQSSVGAPIEVDGALWGLVIASTKAGRAFPADTESRIAAFSELVASAISNTEARAARERLAEEQAALRRVATLIAREASQAEVFAAVAEELGRLMGVDHVRMWRFDDDDAAVAVASAGTFGDAMPVGARERLDDDSLAGRVRRTRRSQRIDDYAEVGGPIAERALAIGAGSAVSTPIDVEGRLWGAMVAVSRQPRQLPDDTEARMAQFTELMATAIANTESRATAERLAAEQAALRRVATLVAAGGAPDDVFSAVGDEVRRLVGNDLTSMFRYEAGDTLTLVAVRARAEPIPDGLLGARIPMRRQFARFLEAGRPVRLDASGTAQWITDLPAAEPLGLRSAIGVPIVVGGRPWGAIFVCATSDDGIPPEAERPFAQFTELVGTAIANAQARTEISRLADEQAALRRVATLVAREAPQSEIFNAIAEESAQLLGAAEMRLLRYERDTEAVIVGSTGAVGAFPLGSRFPLTGESVSTLVFETGRPARIDDYSRDASGAIADAAKATGLRGVVGTPIVVEGRLWGVMGAATYRDEPLPPDTESRLGQFTELMATAIANAEARTQVERLAEEQSALRRVATLVAEGASPTAVFDAVAAEMAALLGADGVTLARYEPGDELTVVAHRGAATPQLPPGTRMHHGNAGVSATVRRTERPARVESYGDAELAEALGIRAAVGAPIVVDGRLWGVTVAQWGGDVALPAATEERMSQFAELLDTAIANADGRDQLTASRARLLTAADEARRRVVRDLHDGAQQRLVHTIVTLSLAQQALRDDGEQAESLVAQALDHARQGNAELRELAHGILPSALTHGGLPAGIDAVVARLDLPVDVDLPAERFPREVEASVYFVVAEALTNVVKHAHATRAEVTARVVDGKLRVEVRDDGLGGADPGGHGLVGMDDRVTALGGRLEIGSPAGGGTLLSATLPV